MLASGLVGQNSTVGGEAVVSGIYNKASYSVGYSKFKTDGFRVNNDQDDDIANAFLQYELSYKTSIQAEYRYRNIERGDVDLRFFPDETSPNLDETLESNTVRLGFRQAFSPRSSLIGNFTYRDLEETEKDNPAPVIAYDGKSDQEAYSAELSYLFRAEKFNVVTGGGYFDIDGQDNLVITTQDIIIPLPPPLPPQVIPGSSTTISEVKDVKHANVYLYSYINFLHDVTVTLGASGDFYEPENTQEEDQNQFNPKVGITWNPLPDTTIRGSSFQSAQKNTGYGSDS